MIPYTGGKTRDLPHLLPLLGSGDLLVSPFCGSAAAEIEALESGAFKRAILTDASPYIVAVLRACQTDPAGLHRVQMATRDYIDGRKPRMEVMQTNVAKAIRGNVSDVDVGGVALGISCWSFSRLWRVDGCGRLNASMDPGGRPPVDLSELERIGRSLEHAKIYCARWDHIRHYVPADATILVDPPYLGEGGFTAYTPTGWREMDARILAGTLAGLPNRIVVCEQDPGGGPIYEAILGGVNHRRSMDRNVRGDQQARGRSECIIVRESTGGRHV